MSRTDLDCLLEACAAGRLSPDEQRRLAHHLPAAPGIRRRAGRRCSWLVGVLIAAGCLVADPTTPTGDTPFATVNGTVVPFGTFYWTLQDMAGGEAVERVLLEEIMRQAAEKAGTMPTEAEIDERLAQVIGERFSGNAAAAGEWLVSRGLDETALRRMTRVEVMDLKLRTKDLKYTDADVAKYYADHKKDRYTIPETVKFREIVLATKEDATKLVADLTAGKTTFFEAATKSSLNAETAPQGGLVPPQPVPFLEENTPALAAGLKPLAVGDYTKTPVSFNNQWYLLLLVSREPGKDVPYTDIAARVKRDFLLEKAPAEETFYGDLAKQAKIAGVPMRYRGIQERFGSGQTSGKAPLGPTPNN